MTWPVPPLGPPYASTWRNATADMITDPRFRTNSERVRNAEACEAPIVAFIGARTLAENMEIFERAEVTAAPVYDIDQFMADPL